MNDNDFVKLSHFDRIRRGYFDKIPMNFCFIGLLFALNLFYASTNVIFVLGACLFVIGFFFKEKLIEQDNAEIQKYSHEIENEHQKYLKQMKG